MRLRATTRWVSPALLIPNEGSVQRPLSGQALDVSEAQARWLIDQGYATAMEAALPQPPVPERTVTAAKKPDPVPVPDEPLAEASEEESLSPWQAEALSFFSSTTDKEAIDERVDGIGPKTAAKILKADRPLTWAALDDILSASQVQAVQSVFDQSEDS